MGNNLFNISDKAKASLNQKWNITKGNEEDVAIIGIGLKFAGCDTPLEYWDLISKGKDMVSSFPNERKKELDTLFSFCDDSFVRTKDFKKASYLDQISCFDHGKYKVTKSEAILMCPKQRLILQVAHQAIEDAGLPFSEIKGTNTAVYIGHSSYGYKYADFLRGLKEEYFQLSVPGNIEAIIPSRISYLLDLKGPSLLIDTACSSSLVAVYHAYKSIVEGGCDMALAGGVRIMFYPQDLSKDIKIGIESLDGKTRTFDKSSTGTGTGEGAACILMKPLDRALKDGNAIYAVLKGGAINQDGKSVGITAPNGKAQKELLESAWKNTGISPEQIGYIEAHGTGTKLGDPIEINAIKEAFEQYTDRKQFCAISSVKTNLGHLDSVAGIAGFIKASLAIKFGKIPKQIHFDFPNDEIDLVKSPLYVNIAERDWKDHENKYCGVSSFGISGTNCHLILGESLPSAKKNEIKRYYTLPISSYDSTGLEKAITRLKQAVFDDENIDMYSLGYRLSIREHRSVRLIFIVDSRDSFLEKMQYFLDSDRNDVENLIFSEDSLKDFVNKEENKAITEYLAGKECTLHQFYNMEKTSPLHIPVFPDKPMVCWPSSNELKKKEMSNTMNNCNQELRINGEVNIRNRAPILDKNSVFQQVTKFIKSIFDSDEINFRTPFFDLGFDSISIIQLQQFIKSQFHMELTIEQLYRELNTLEALVDYILQNQEHSGISVPKLEEQRIDDTLTDNLCDIPADKHANAEGMPHVIKEVFDKQFEILNAQLRVVNNYFSANPAPINSSLAKVIRNEKKPSTSSHFRSFKKITNEKQQLPPKERLYIKKFIENYEEKTGSSKKFAENNRHSWANHRNVSQYNHDWKELAYPIIADRAEGASMWDLDNNKYIDFSMGFGVYLLGYNHIWGTDALSKYGKTHNFLGPISQDAVEVADLIKELTGVDRVAFYNSGTEAVMVALRIARGATGKQKIVVFAGSYHGTFDGINVDQASDYSAIPLTPGIPEGMVEDVLVLNYGTKEAIEIIQKYKEEIAAVLVEPVQSRRVDFQPKSYLQELREITQKEKIVLIFDEVITGFRIAPGGAQEYFDTQADLVTYGKILGGGMPIGVVAGKSEYIDLIDGGAWNYGDESYPNVQRVSVAGTFCHHPLTMKVAAKMLTYLKEKGSSLQFELNRKTDLLVNELNVFFIDHDLPFKANNFGSMFNIKPKSNLELLELVKYHLLYNGIFVWEGATCFISEAHTNDDIRYFIDTIKKSVYQILDGGFFEENIAEKLTRNRVKNLERRYMLPPTMEQKRMLARIEMNPQETVAFNETVIVEVNRKLNKEVLQATLNLVSARHEALRITSITESGQSIASYVQIPIQYASPEDRKSTKDTIGRWLSTNVLIPFDLKNGPFIRCFVLECNDESFLVHLVAHHIVIDGWSLNTLMKEFEQVYQSYNLNSNSTLPPAKQYSDYVSWVEEQVNGDTHRNFEFWKNEFLTVVPRFEVPILTIESYNVKGGGLIYFKIESDILKNIKSWNSAHEVSLFSTLLSIYKVMLCMISGNSNLRVAIPYSGQLNSGFYDAIGQCVQMVPFINTLDVESTPIDFVQKTMQKSLAILRHPVVPYELLVDNKDAFKNCVYEDTVVFNLDKVTHDKNDKGFLDDIVLESRNKYDLFFDVLERGSELIFRVEFDNQKYPIACVQEWITLYKSILECFLDNGDLPIKTLLSENTIR